MKKTSHLQDSNTHLETTILNEWPRVLRSTATVNPSSRPLSTSEWKIFQHLIRSALTIRPKIENKFKTFSLSTYARLLTAAISLVHLHCMLSNSLISLKYPTFQTLKQKSIIGLMCDTNNETINTEV